MSDFYPVASEIHTIASSQSEWENIRIEVWTIFELELHGEIQP
jgi:hypothetical protein